MRQNSSSAKVSPPFLSKSSKLPVRHQFHLKYVTITSFSTTSVLSLLPSTNSLSLLPPSPDAKDILDSDAFTEPPANPVRPIAPAIAPTILVPTELIPLISFDPRPTIALPTMGNFPNEPVSPFAITPPSFPKPTVIPFPSGSNFTNIPFVTLVKELT